jgi:DNA-binding transcriptional MocR family regulator
MIVGMTISETDWFPHSLDSSLPMYKAIVEAIERDIAVSALSPGDKLPPQRSLASKIGIDFTTVSRAYTEAKKRGLLIARVGQGTFVSERQTMLNKGPVQSNAPTSNIIDMGMNTPPMPQDASLLQRMKQEMAETVSQMTDVELLAYQNFFGTPHERTVAANWISTHFETSAEQVLICPGTQSTLLALLKLLVKPGTTICSENLCYPGFSAAAQKLGLRHIGLEMDNDGIIPKAFEKACDNNRVSVLYCTPTQHNPTTITWSKQRREEIARIAEHYRVQIIEDDAYGFLSPDAPAPLSSHLPKQAYYIAGLAKCLSSALRVTFLSCPDRLRVKETAEILRATSLMASPITKAMAINLISSGCAGLITKSISEAALHRQKLVRQILNGLEYQAHPQGFHVWLTLPSSWSQSDFIDRMREHSVRLVHSDAFSLTNDKPHALRLCLGAIESYERTRDVLQIIERLLKDETGYNSTVV